LSEEQVLDFVASQSENPLHPSQVSQSEWVLARNVIAGTADDRNVFPLKVHVGSKTKVNVFFGDIAKDASDIDGDATLRIVALLLLRARKVLKRQMYNDEASGWLAWLMVCDTAGLDIGSLLAMDYDELKEFSNIVKGIGVAGSKHLHLLAEPNVLLGRGVKTVDWEDEMHKRTRPYEMKGMLALFDEAELRRAIESVVAEERGNFRPPNWKKAWERRFATTKAGSHSKRLKSDRELPNRQLTRRNYVEACTYKDVWAVEPGGVITASEKLENGATRAIYSLDSDNYLRFDSPARALEDSWLNKRAILKPASGMSALEVEKRARALRNYHMMFDYSDFNSAHTLRAMELVIRIAFRGMDQEWLEWLAQSVYNMKVLDPTSGKYAKFKGTLPSGHRLTTIINTILNAAYMRIVLGELYSKMFMYHVGDDVVASCIRPEDAHEAVNRVMSSCLNMNPSKQGFGTVCAEFLRISYTREIAVGYFCRSIASGVSGNWVTLRLLSEEEYSEAVSNLIWTWRQRSQSECVALLWARTLVRRLRLNLKEARAVCTGEASLNGSPLWGIRKHAMRLLLSGGQNKRSLSRSVDGVRLPKLAAEDFKKQSREYFVLKGMGISPSILDEVMLEASYGNMSEDNGSTPPKWWRETLTLGNTIVRGIGRSLESRYSRKRKPGLLTSALKGRLEDWQWAELGEQLGFDHRPYLSYAKKKVASFCFGVPYSDARESQAKYRSHVVYANQYKSMY
jgi:hypothetical protein